MSEVTADFHVKIGIVFVEKVREAGAKEGEGEGEKSKQEEDKVAV